MKIKCVIIDDEHLARQYLKDYVSKVPFLELIGDFNSPLKALDLIKSNEIDLIFLDIQMPDITGLDFIKTLEKPPFVILTTAYKEYALEGYELNIRDHKKSKIINHKVNKNSLRKCSYKLCMKSSL